MAKSQLTEPAQTAFFGQPSSTDLLLDWLSAQGNGSDEQFNQICRSLQIQDYPENVRRNLQLLGHLDLEPGGKRWSVSPSAWVKACDGSWFLAGQRRAEWRQDLRLAQLQQELAPLHLSASEPIMDLAGLELAKADCLADQLLERLLEMQSWIDDLVEYPLLHPLSAYQIEVWHVDKRRFETWHRQATLKPGIYQLSRRVGRYTKSERLYWDGKRWLIADFTGLRFVQEYHAGLALEVWYRAETQDVWVPLEQRWPFIYERCLVMCKGMLPQLTQVPGQTRQALHYSAVPAHYLEKFTRNLIDIHVQELGHG